MRSGDTATVKYLGAHAEPEAQLTARVGSEPLAEVVVIPAYGEGEKLLTTLDSIPPSAEGAVAIIVVVNARSDSPGTLRSANQSTCSSLRERFGSGSELAGGVQRLEHPLGPLVLVERSSPGRFLPPRQGVGLARKVGADLALGLAANGQLRSAFIHCTDADALLPVDYFEQSARAQAAETALLLYPFRHVSSANAAGRASQAALEYEASLRYYVLGLQHARSRHAFHTIGSTFAVNARAYAEVRGFPRRMAGEDFYLANKLCKVGAVGSLSGDPILLSDRESGRVPFGTGAALLRARAEGGASRRTYAPIVFEFLRSWLSALGALQREPDRSLEDALADCAGAEVDVDFLIDVARQRGLWQRVRRALAHSREEQRRRQLHDAFDAFQTLKLIHALRDQRYPAIELRRALAEAPFLELSGDEDMLDICQTLARFERVAA